VSLRQRSARGRYQHGRGELTVPVSNVSVLWEALAPAAALLLAPHLGSLNAGHLWKRKKKTLATIWLLHVDDDARLGRLRLGDKTLPYRQHPAGQGGFAAAGERRW